MLPLNSWLNAIPFLWVGQLRRIDTTIILFGSVTNENALYLQKYLFLFCNWNIHIISIVESLGFCEEKNKESEQGGRTRRLTEKSLIV